MLNGWAIPGLIAVCAALLLIVLRLPRSAWPLTAACLMFGAAGYARQQHADLGERLAVADAVKLPPAQSYKELRDGLYGRFNAESAYFGISDSQLAEGDATLAANVIIGGLQALPDDVALWSELGNIIALHDRGMVTPAAAVAYHRAMTLSPQHPGPPFMLGYAYVRSGEFAKARPYWMRALALTPAKAEYRGAIAARLALLDQALAGPRSPAR